MTGWKHDRRSRQARGYDRRYDAARKVVMQVNAEGKPTALCRMCWEREQRATPARECDHIIPKHKADANGMVKLPSGERVHFNDVRAMQPLCIPCHEAKTAQEAVEATGRALRPVRAVGLDGYPIEQGSG